MHEASVKLVKQSCEGSQYRTCGQAQRDKSIWRDREGS
jgi:hypothetical protein